MIPVKMFRDTSFRDTSSGHGGPRKEKKEEAEFMETVTSITTQLRKRFFRNLNIFTYLCGGNDKQRVQRDAKQEGEVLETVEKIIARLCC